MKITFLGTGAGEGYPAHWCECPHCQWARKYGGKNIRGNSCALIDDCVLIDLSHSGPLQAAALGISLAHVHTLLITHAHADHLYPEHLTWRYGNENSETMTYGEMIRNGGPRHTPVPMLNIFGNQAAREKISPMLDVSPSRHLDFSLIIPGQTAESNGYRITAVRGNHVNAEYTNNYIISKGNETLLYASDTGLYDDETWDIVLSHQYDLVVMEGTAGINPNGAGDGHMSLDKNRTVLDKLKQNGCMKNGAPYVLTHMSPHWTPPHDWFVTIAEKEGMTVAYDGLTIE